jgi:hypothetical protein
MGNYVYCEDCKRIFPLKSNCPFCESTKVSELCLKAPVNILGTKVKGRVFKLASDVIKVLIVDEGQNKSIREYEASKLKKIL